MRRKEQAMIAFAKNIMLLVLVMVGWLPLLIGLGLSSSHHSCLDYYPSRPEQCAGEVVFCCEAGYSVCGDSAQCEVKPDDL